jgi:hypothetical protein
MYVKMKLSGLVTTVLICNRADSLISTRIPEAQVTMEGFVGEKHSGITMSSDSRTKQYPRGTLIRNSRQVSIVSLEEMAEVARDLGIPEIQPEWLGANLLLQGFPNLTFIPPATRLYFPGEAVLIVQGENNPCVTAGEAVQQNLPDYPDLAQRFVKAAYHKRGIVAWVERPGLIRAGDEVQAEIPEQVIYPL